MTGTVQMKLHLLLLALLELLKGYLSSIVTIHTNAHIVKLLFFCGEPEAIRVAIIKTLALDKSLIYPFQ